MSLLIIDKYIEPAACASLVAAYRKAIKKGQVKPRGHLTTDAGLPALFPSGVCSACCGHEDVAVRELRDRVGVLLAEFFGLPMLHPDYSAYTRVKAGGSHELHADAVKLTGEPNHTPHRTATAMLYLSNIGQEFAGGRICFPGVGPVVDPLAGRLVGFPCTLRYRHYVEKVTRGERDALAFWFTVDPRKAERWPA